MKVALLLQFYFIPSLAQRVVTFVLRTQYENDNAMQLPACIDHLKPVKPLKIYVYLPKRLFWNKKSELRSRIEFNLKHLIFCSLISLGNAVT